MPSVDELEAQMISLINAERADAGVGAVQPIGWAHSVARQHAEEMAAAGDIWHNIAGFINRGRAAMGATYLGENVAMDSTLAAADALLYSDIPHRNITLDGRFNFVGLGIALDSRNWVYVTEDFAQIPGGAAPAAAAITKPAATQAPPVVKAPVVKAPVVKAPVAVATTKPAPVKAPVAVATPAPVVAAPIVAAAVAAQPAPALTPAAPAAPAPQPAQAIPAKTVSNSSPTMDGGWILLALVCLLTAALSVRRFASILRNARAQRPVATARSLGASPSSRRAWRRPA
jgi:hypothetical protein